MIVVCIKTFKTFFNKIYNIGDEIIVTQSINFLNNDWYISISDEHYLPSSHFITLNEYRNEKLNKILK